MSAGSVAPRALGRLLTLAVLIAVATLAACKGGDARPSDADGDAPRDGGDLAVGDMSIDLAAHDMLPLDAPLSLPPVDMCTSAGWCLRHPLPHPTSINALWTRTASTPHVLFAGNDSGALLTYDGTSWKRMGSGLSSSIVDVWGRGQSELFVATNYSNFGRLRRHDGSAWSEVYRTKHLGSIVAVAGSGSLTYAAIYEDARGRIIRDSGSGFARVHSASKTGVRYYDLALDGAEVLAVGSQGEISSFDGSAWRSEQSGTVNSLYGVWSSGGTAFVVGANGTVLRRVKPGDPYKPMATATQATLRAVWGRAPDDVYAVGELYSSFGSRRRYVVLHFDGSGWSRVHEGAPAAATTSSADLRAIAERDGEIFAGGRLGALVAADASGTWRRVSSRATDASLTSAWTDGTKVVVGGQYGRLLEKRSDDKWVEIELDLPFTVQALWGRGDVLFAGGSAIHAFDGSAWKALPTGDNQVTVYGLWGAAVDDLYAVGANGIILHYDGKTVAPMASGTSLSLRGVWGASKRAIFATGGNAVVRYDGSQWSTLEVGPIDHFYYGVWGTSANDVFVVGRDNKSKKALVRHYDGAQWTDTLLDSDKTLYAVAGISASDVVAVGTSGYVVHFDGTSWSTAATGFGWSFTALACAAPQGCFAVTQSATVLQRAPAAP